MRFERLNATSVRIRVWSSGTILIDTIDHDALPGSYTPGLLTSASSNIRFDNFFAWEYGASCTNGILDGDERFVDCGGACTPCNDTTVMQLDFSNTRDIRGWSVVSQTVNGGVPNWHINSGQLR